MVVTEKEALNRWCPMSLNKTPEPCQGKSCMAFTYFSKVESRTSSLLPYHTDYYYYCGMIGEKPRERNG